MAFLQRNCKSTLKATFRLKLIISQLKYGLRVLQWMILAMSYLASIFLNVKMSACRRASLPFSAHHNVELLIKVRSGGECHV